MEIAIDNPLHAKAAAAAAPPIDADTIALKAKGGYAALLDATQQHMPAVPDVTIAYKDVSYTVQIPAKASDVHKIPTVTSTLVGAALSLPRALARAFTGASTSEPAASRTQPFVVLDKVSGVIKPGTMTLIVAPPGHGKSSMLKMLANRLQLEHTSTGKGDKGKGKGLAATAAAPSTARGEEAWVRYSGLTPAEASTAGINLKALLGLADQIDLHTPQLTVRETLSFAAYNSHVSESHLPPALRPVAQARVATTLKLLGMEECADTVVGNEILRGISGGQKKRVTIAEVLLSPARAYLLDEVTSGLDASVSFDLMSHIRTWARTTKGTVVAALQQPTPELWSLFDDVILMREGAVVYHGPREGVLPYLAGLGHAPPEGIDTADWLVDMLNDPAKSAESTAKGKGRKGGAGTAPVAAVAAVAVTTTPELVAAWKGSRGYATLMAQADEQATGEAGAGQTLALTSPYAQAQFGRAYARPLLAHFFSLLDRQVRLSMRDFNTIFAKIGQAIIMGLVLGSLFWKLDLSPSGAFLKLSLLLFAIINVAFSNFTQIPMAMATRYVLYKELDASRYPPSAFIAGMVVADLPLAVLESVLFGIILYTMSGFADDAGRTVYFLFLLFLTSIALCGYFRLVAFLAPNLEVSNTATGPVVSIMVVFSGYLITRDKLPRWLLGAFYLSPFSWSLTAMAQNEFGSSGYDTKPDPTRPGTTLGDIYLEAYEFTTDRSYLWAACIYLLFVFAAFALCGSCVVSRVRYERNVGTSRIGSGAEEEEGEAVAGAAGKVETAVAALPAPAGEAAAAEGGSSSSPAKVAPAPAAAIPGPASSSGLHALPFHPVALTFSDIKYEVQLPRKLGGGRRALLRGVSGYAQPGTMTALMGASGAGKTTLLDCLAGRKNAGWLTGKVLVNGAEADKATFSRLSCYVEQADVHLAHATVREALEFSAHLRLPASVTASQRATFIDEVLDILEMKDLADRLIGDEDSATGLSPSQRKRLTIGVELVSNAPVLFLDEPTTGLDSRAAAIVMRVIRRIASTGRTVICTIHQPSENLFLMFDELLLLTRGGYEVYCGPLGAGRAGALVGYLQALPGVRPCPPEMNPASWMLDVLAGVGSAVEAEGQTGEAAAGSGSGDPTAAAAGAAPASAPLTIKASRDASEEEEEADHTDAHGHRLKRVGTEAVALSQAHTPKPSITVLAVDGATAPATTTVTLDFCDAYHASPLYATALARITELDKEHSGPGSAGLPSHFNSRFARSWGVQFTQNVIRSWRAYHRNVQYNLTRVAALTFLALLFGTIYFRIEANTIGGITSKISVLFLAMAFSGVMNFGTVLGVVAKQRAVFYRERSSNMYSPEPYALSLALVELPWIALQSVVFCAILYFMAGFKESGEAWAHFAATFALCALSYNYQGQLFAAAFPNVIVAQAVGGLVTTLSFLFAGLFAPAPTIPAGWKWLWFANPTTYALEGVAMAQFHCDGGAAAGCPSIIVTTPQGPFPVDVSTYVASYFGMEPADMWIDVGVLAAFTGIFAVLNLLAVRFISHVTR